MRRFLAPGQLVALSIAFLSTIVPFYHGMNRHLFDAHIAKIGVGEGGRSVPLLLDIFVFVLEGGLLFAMGRSIDHSPRFFCALEHAACSRHRVVAGNLENPEEPLSKMGEEQRILGNFGRSDVVGTADCGGVSRFRSGSRRFCHCLLRRTDGSCAIHYRLRCELEFLLPDIQRLRLARLRIGARYATGTHADPKRRIFSRLRRRVLQESGSRPCPSHR